MDGIFGRALRLVIDAYSSEASSFPSSPPFDKCPSSRMRVSVRPMQSPATSRPTHGLPASVSWQRYNPRLPRVVFISVRARAHTHTLKSCPPPLPDSGGESFISARRIRKRRARDCLPQRQASRADGHPSRWSLIAGRRPTMQYRRSMAHAIDMYLHQ